MPKVAPAMIDYDRPDEHSLRRLAGALLVQWNELTPAQQTVIVTQALVMTDRHTSLTRTPPQEAMRDFLEERVPRATKVNR